MLRVADKGLQESISTDIILRESESEQFYGASLKKQVKQKKCWLVLNYRTSYGKQTAVKT